MKIVSTSIQNTPNQSLQQTRKAAGFSSNLKLSHAFQAAELDRYQQRTISATYVIPCH